MTWISLFFFLSLSFSLSLICEWNNVQHILFHTGCSCKLLFSISRPLPSISISFHCVDCPFKTTKVNAHLIDRLLLEAVIASMQICSLRLKSGLSCQKSLYEPKISCIISHIFVFTDEISWWSKCPNFMKREISSTKPKGNEFTALKLLCMVINGTSNHHVTTIEKCHHCIMKQIYLAISFWQLMQISY